MAATLRIQMFVLLSFVLITCCVATAVSDCSCGFRDDAAGLLFTESIITYFNESGVENEDYITESYTNRAEKSWNALYRQGASPENVAPVNGALDLSVNPPTKNHVVIGGGIRTRRQDMLHGSFRALVRSPPPSREGGSVLTMAVEYDNTESLSVNMMNTDKPSTAWLSTLMRGEFPTGPLGVQYRDIAAAAMQNSSFRSPWDFIELRMDWTENKVAWFVQGNLTRLSKKGDVLPQTPSPLYLRHWSTGDRYTSQGPPANRTSSEVGWGRFFFNSSLMSLEQHQTYDTRCRHETPCSINDVNLRGSSTYDARALLSWRLIKPNGKKRIPAIVVSILSVVTTAFLIMHTVLRRKPWKKSNQLPKPVHLSQRPASPSALEDSTVWDAVSPYTGATAMKAGYNSGFRNSRSLLAVPITPRSESTRSPTATHFGLTNLDFSAAPTLADREYAARHQGIDDILPALDGCSGVESDEKRPSSVLREITGAGGGQPQPSTQTNQIWLVDSSDPALGGLLVICAIVIAGVDFALTFVPALIQSNVAVHYESETWSRKTIVPFFLSFIWVGPIVTISPRLLTATYLRQGNLEEIARQTASQSPRFMIPVILVSLIEYFLINTGTTTWLNQISCLTWSEWPYTTTYSNFANWLTELIELAYLVPNAPPAITFHYCTGVLWLIPVLLQCSWTILLGVVVVREITSPWKRFLYYGFAILTNWYAQSWSTFLWAGVMLVDMEVTYDYKTKLASRTWPSAAVLAGFLVLALLGGTADLVSEWTTYNFSIVEHDIHPDASSALPLGRTGNAGYPPYYVPRLSAFCFAVGLHGIVEISSSIQRLLSTRFIAKLAPHSLTIYLIHGVIFWSWGAWLTVTLAGTVGLPYWAVLLLVAITSGALLGLTLPILTPVLRVAERNFTACIWHTAVIEPPIKRKTVFPFEQTLIEDYNNNGTIKGV